MPITSTIFGDRGKRRAEKLGIPVDRLPPGQSPTEKFPVLTIGASPRLSTEQWSFAIHGLVERPFALRWEELLALPQVTQRSDLHCVTRWSKFDTDWVGVRVRDLVERAGAKPAATHVLIHAHGGYTTNLPLEVLLGDDVLLTHTFDGQPLERDHGGPVRLLVPQRYLWKSAKWVSALELLDHDEPGIWEQNGYHNDGDFWTEQRFSEDPLAFRENRRRVRSGS